ncbi:cytochrome P450 [Rhizorhapis suberifaciens]|uniref:Cytochrome P450 n=1 Tax=Rhizorhapis suberifaciens TaxID=13656 RepID=A0A840HRJ3_9SPHN|nr:cytochrome P450 [Rhizorhapis suberifaciens]MBB4640164.1 cytochrome P450 [Rhizorhapis suberifaciens]
MAQWQELDDNLTTSAYFTTGKFYEDFRRLRSEDPVHWTNGCNGVKPFWSITRYADCVTVLEDPHAFSSEYGGIMPLTAEEPTPEQREALGFDSMATFLDPPRHLPLRQPFNKHFSVPAIARLRNAVQSIVDQLLSDVLPRGECDLVDDIAGPLPALVVCEMMGIPREDWDKVRYYCTAFMGAQDPENQIDGDRVKTQRTMIKALFDYMFDLAMQRRAKPTDDFTSLVSNMVLANGERMSERDVGWWCFSLVVAGLETTRGALSVGFLGLIENPEQAALLRSESSLAPQAAEEVVRWVSPSKHKFRVATRDYELHGKLIRKGDWVVPWLASANRDETIFENPNKLDITRSPNPHLGFSIGTHNCLGRHLTRMEMQLMLSAVVQHMPDLELAGEVSWLVSDNTSSLTKLPVRFTQKRSLAA